MKNMLRCLGGPPSSKDCRLGCFHLGGRGTVSMYAGYDATIPFCFIWLFSFKRERICWRSLRQTTFSSEDWRISSCREDCPSVMFFFGLLVSPILSDLGGSPSLFCLVFWANKSSPYIISIILSSLSSVLFFEFGYGFCRGYFVFVGYKDVFCSWNLWWDGTCQPSLRTHRKTGHHRVLFGPRDCHIWQPILLAFVLGFFFPTSPLLAFAEIQFLSTEQARGVSESISGTILPLFIRLTHHVNR